MKIFLAGATGAIGRPLLRRLVRGGHEVVGTTRSPEKLRELEAAGAAGVVLDALDACAVERALAAARPDVVIHQLTSLPRAPTPRAMRAGMAETGRLRRETVPVFARAAAAAGARRLIVQSISFVTRPQGPPDLDEDGPLWLDAPRGFREAVTTVRDLEAATIGAAGVEGVVLRYGFFYGPGTWYAPDGAIMQLIRRRLYPDVGDGNGRMSFVHVEDAAEATELALERGGRGVYNITDQAPAVHREWLAAMVKWLGAPPPWRIPAWLTRVLAGPAAVYYATTLRGASSAKARRELGWQPRPWREGFGQLFESSG